MNKEKKRRENDAINKSEKERAEWGWYSLNRAKLVSWLNCGQGRSLCCSCLLQNSQITSKNWLRRIPPSSSDHHSQSCYQETKTTKEREIWSGLQLSGDGWRTKRTVIPCVSKQVNWRVIFMGGKKQTFHNIVETYPLTEYLRSKVMGVEFDLTCLRVMRNKIPYYMKKRAQNLQNWGIWPYW